MSARVDSRRGILAEWLDQRVGWRKLMHEALDEPIPGGSRWAYVFGSGLLFIFVNQIVTGIFLSLYYVPSIDHAHTTVSFIQKQVTAGSFIRSLHSYGSSVMVVLLMLHLAQTYFYGAYKSRRELLWIVGCFLFLLVLGMSFTGYLLPWDQKAYFATAVATNIISEVPVIGGALKTLLRGGTEMSTLTLSRFFMLHVFLIPGLIFAAVRAHVYLFRKAGAAGPPLKEEQRRALPVVSFFPAQVVKDFIFGIGLIVALGTLSWARPTTIGPVANPADPTYLPRPEWYYIPVFQWLKYWHGAASLLGIVIIPAIVLLLLFTAPFLDRSPERRAARRPIPVSLFLVILGGLVFLGYRSSVEDRRDPSVHAKLLAQEKAEAEYARAPFEPEQMASKASSEASLTPQQAKGSLLFESESCSACHGPSGRGGDGLAKLKRLKDRYSADQLGELLRHPRPAMLEGGMEPSKLAAQDLESLVAYLRALKE
ncbi:MAG TPA: cytochrome b N-terminal domain-containing protein [Candidatus Polarisedimenticolia bacterium]|nr:cytochrome b N-terminal domain-containing protein [Candidatus Polarisedimenticolia bacterium]